MSQFQSYKNITIIKNTLIMTQTLKILILSLALLSSTALAYTNPVQGARDSPDPGVLYDGHNYYAVTTEGWDQHYFPIWKSADLFTWSHQGFVFLNKPPWAVQNFWAPEMHIVGHQYLVYYTARDSTGFLCIGVASSDSPLGPFIDKGVPLLKNVTEGVIDCTIHQQNGQIYLVYKVDGNAHGKPTQIHAILLTTDGKSLNGVNHFLFRNSLAWENGIVQAPWVTKDNGTYYIFYSSCGYNNKCYSVGVARSKAFLGPYEKHPNPILFTRPQETSQSWEGPGHCSVVKSLKGNYAIVYHAWPHGAINTKRVMLVDKLTFVNGWPKVGEGFPTETQQPDF